MTEAKLRPHRGMEQLDHDRIVGRYLAVLLPRLHDPRAAWAVAHNCWVVFCALENRSFSQPEELLREMSLEEIAGLAQEYRERFEEESSWEGAVNESYSSQVEGGAPHDADAAGPSA